MSKRTIFILASAVAVLAVLFIAADSEAGLLDKLKKDTKAKKTGQFSLTGKYTGTIAGEIKIKKDKVWITKNTAVYNADRGAARAGLVVTNRSVYISGKWKDGVRVASVVYVRSALDRAGRGDQEAKKYRIQSSSNPNVGELTEDIEN